MRYPFFCSAWWPRAALCGPVYWFRVYGYGLHISTRRREDALFSERNGLQKALYLFGLRVEALKP